MTLITKEEAIAIKEKYPDVYVTITNRQKKASQKRRYVEESPRIINFLRKLRGEDTRDYRKPNRRKR